MTYTHHNHHRSLFFAAQKSQWTISEPFEVNCYQLALAQNWKASGAYWSLHLIKKAPHQLGHSPTPDAHPLHIAKFVGEDGGD